MPRVHTVTARKPRGNCNKCREPIDPGQRYYKWKFRYASERRRHVACGRPGRSDLTQSEFYGGMYAIEDNLQAALGDASSKDEVQSAFEDARSEVETLHDECEEKLQNMEEYNLTGGSSWELLEERRDQLDTIIGEIDNLDLDQLEVECDSCAGEGEVTDDCPECGGDGLDLDSKEEKPCGVCKGEGEVTEHCDECDGSGEGPFDSEVATGLFEEVSWDYS